jgi:hypothetical protein
MPVTVEHLGECMLIATEVPNIYKASRYKSEALRFYHSVATLLNPHGVTTVSHKCSLTVTRHATVVVVVPSVVHYPANYKTKIYYLR